jgi:hypothetical protein
MQELRIVFDTAEAEAQMKELTELVNGLFPEGPSDEIVENLKRLSLNIILSDRRTTVGADGIGQYIIRPRFGAGYDNLMAAMRAGKIDRVSHEQKL